MLRWRRHKTIPASLVKSERCAAC